MNWHIMNSCARLNSIYYPFSILAEHVEATGRILTQLLVDHSAQLTLNPTDGELLRQVQLCYVAHLHTCSFTYCQFEYYKSALPVSPSISQHFERSIRFFRPLVCVRIRTPIKKRITDYMQIIIMQVMITCLFVTLFVNYAILWWNIFFAWI